jgi:hypothetical protein
MEEKKFGGRILEVRYKFKDSFYNVNSKLQILLSILRHVKIFSKRNEVSVNKSRDIIFLHQQRYYHPH